MRRGLPPRVAEFLKREIRRSWMGDPRLSATAMRLLCDAIDPHAADLASALGRAEPQPDGSLILDIPRHVDFRFPDLAETQGSIGVRFHPRSGRWLSELTTGWSSFPRLAGYVWRVKGGPGRMPEYQVLALIGLAYLFALREERS